MYRQGLSMVLITVVLMCSYTLSVYQVSHCLMMPRYAKQTQSHLVNDN